MVADYIEDSFRQDIHSIYASALDADGLANLLREYLQEDIRINGRICVHKRFDDKAGRI